MNLDLTVKATDIAIVIATVFGPVLAVQTQKWLEKHREIKAQRIWIFRTLMATRAATLSAQHVEALNSISLAYYGRGAGLKGIVDAWKEYLEHLGKDQTQMPPEIWNPKRHELLVSLMHKMAIYSGYDFNKVEIANEIYSPRGHAEIETDQDIIRRGLAQLLSGQLTLPMELKSLPSDPQVLLENKSIREALLKWLSGQSAVAITSRSGPDSGESQLR